MIDSISLSNFKAFSEQVTFEPKGGSMIVCGENGSGKSSLFEAFRWLFFKQEIFDRRIHASVAPESRPGEEATIQASLNNKKTGTEFEMTIDGRPYNEFDTEPYQVSMMDSGCYSQNEEISITDLLRIWYLKVNNLRNFMNANRSLIEEYVNTNLKSIFLEDVQISISVESPYLCTLKNEVRRLQADKNLNYYFNESKLHVVILLLFLSIVSLNKKQDKRQLVIFDDVVSSMDTANRIAITKCLLTVKKDETLTVYFFTHSVGFFNLFLHVAQNYSPVKDDNIGNKKWTKYHLYELSAVPRVYPLSTVKSVDELKKELDSFKEGDGLDDIGNKIRRKFEETVFRFTELLMVGAKEETAKLLGSLEYEYFYFSGSGQGIDSLIHEIEGILINAPEQLIPEKVKAVIGKYKTKNDFLRVILSDFTLYQKVSLHPMSHTGPGMINYSLKDLQYSVNLLEQMEKKIARLEKSEDMSKI